MRCQRCGQREAEIFLSHQLEDGLHSLDLCALCSRRDQGLVLGALIQAQTPGAPPLSEAQEEAVRRALDRVVGTPPDRSGKG
jgi:protein-arginine kinase activator protein McsA